MASSCVSLFPLVQTEAEFFTISELTREFHITPRALRFYEEEGLIAPNRDGPARIYSRRDRARVAWILRGKMMGFSLDEIGELLNLYDLGDGRATQRQVTAQRCRARADVLRQQLDEIQGTIEQLATFASGLEQTPTLKAV